MMAGQKKEFTIFQVVRLKELLRETGSKPVPDTGRRNPGDRARVL